MSKSAGNYYTMRDIVDRGHEPLAFRLLCLQSHYRSRLNFTWDSLGAAGNALQRLRRQVQDWKAAAGEPAAELSPAARELQDEFAEAVSDDLDTPHAVTVLWRAGDADLQPDQRLALVLDLDRVLGLGLEEQAARAGKLPEEVRELIRERDRARQEADYERADAIRDRLQGMGFEVQDTADGTKVRF